MMCFLSYKPICYSNVVVCNICSRSPAETSALAGQMTIFYSGKVNIYDGVPPEKVTLLCPA